MAWYDGQSRRQEHDSPTRRWRHAPRGGRRGAILLAGRAACCPELLDEARAAADGLDAVSAAIGSFLGWPTSTWSTVWPADGAGRDEAKRYVLGAPGDWQMIATTANGQPAAAVYNRDANGTLRAKGIVVLTPTTTGVSRMVAFHHDPTLVAMFGYPNLLAN